MRINSRSIDTDTRGFEYIPDFLTALYSRFDLTESKWLDSMQPWVAITPLSKLNMYMYALYNLS